MITIEECHKNAEECLRWASVAKTEEERKSFLDIARTWTEAAAKADGGSTNDIPNLTESESRSRRTIRFR